MKIYKKMTKIQLLLGFASLVLSIGAFLHNQSTEGLLLATATGAVIWAPSKGSRYIVDVTFAATDTTFAITHGIADPLSIGMSFNTVGSVNPTGLTWTRTSASVITIAHDSLANSACLLRVELATPSTIS